MKNQKFESTYQLILDELSETFRRMDGEQIETLISEMTGAEKIFVVGVGRVLLSLQAWVKRFTQLGLKIYYVGEMVEPAITEKDLLIVGSGSGCTLFPVAIAKKAKELQATVIHIGSNQEGEAAPYADFMVRIPVRTKLYLEDEIESEQPMTSLFEQAIYLLGDVISKIMIEENGLDMKSLWEYHANLE